MQQAAWITEDTDDEDDNNDDNDGGNSDDDDGEGMILDADDDELSEGQGSDHSGLDEEPISTKDLEDDTEADMMTAVCSLCLNKKMQMYDLYIFWLVSS